LKGGEENGTNLNVDSQIHHEIYEDFR